MSCYIDTTTSTNMMVTILRGTTLTFGNITIPPMMAKRRTPIHHHYGAHWIWHDSWRLTCTLFFSQLSTPVTITKSTGRYADREHHSSNPPSCCCTDYLTYGMCTWYDTPAHNRLFHTFCVNITQHSTLGLGAEKIFSPSFCLYAFPDGYH